MPLTPEKLQALAGALRTSGYKSAHTYLAEAKLAHIEKGWNWSNLLDRHFKLCTKAVKRGIGPAKKAPEVAEDIWKAHPLLPDDGTKQGKVKLAPLLFACGVHWMMREIEIAALTSRNVAFDDKTRLVTLTWRESKMDQEGATISRTLQCLCSGSCDISCPYAVLEVLVNQACLQGNEGAALSVSGEGTVATKAQLIADWRDLYGKEITGHSSRRTGALQYIRGGWSVSQVAFLGRWKSNVILEYAKEALQSIPLNADKKLFGSVEGFQAPQEAQDTNLRPSNQHQSNIELVGKLRAEIDSFMDGSKAKSHELDEKVQALEAKFDGYTKFLPNLVKSTRTQVIHRNNKIFLCSPSFMWKTTCGWSYYNSDYEFSNEEVTKVTCQKCIASAHSKEDEKQMPVGPPKWDGSAEGPMHPAADQFSCITDQKESDASCWGGRLVQLTSSSVTVVVHENGTFSEWQRVPLLGMPFWLKISPSSGTMKFLFHTHPPSVMLGSGGEDEKQMPVGPPKWDGSAEGPMHPAADQFSCITDQKESDASCWGGRLVQLTSSSVTVVNGKQLCMCKLCTRTVFLHGLPLAWLPGSCTWIFVVHRSTGQDSFAHLQLRQRSQASVKFMRLALHRHPPLQPSARLHQCTQHTWEIKTGQHALV